MYLEQPRLLLVFNRMMVERSGQILVRHKIRYARDKLAATVCRWLIAACRVHPTGGRQTSRLVRHSIAAGLLQKSIVA